jgi:hypothetical protein
MHALRAQRQTLELRSQFAKIWETYQSPIKPTSRD